MIRALNNTPRNKGVAIVITLCALVLMTVVIVAFFSKAQLNRQIAFSSSNQIRADMLARSAIGIVTGQIKQEAVDGAATAELTDGLMPAKMGVNGADSQLGAFTIVKVAASATPIAPGQPNLGSDVSIDTKSVNGRSESNWFANGPGLGTGQLPTWVYMTRSGPKVPSVTEAKNKTDPNYVLGRFTYTVYETGGLLNANVAGSPTTTPFVASPANKAAKGSIAYADLTTLGLTAAQVDSMVTWRNASIATGTGTPAEKASRFDEWATGIPRVSGTPSEVDLEAARSGHMTIASGDHGFLSRKDLLNYAKSKNLPVAAFGYLSHFEQAKEIPTWKPTFNAPSNNFHYADNAQVNNATTFNRDLNSVLVANADGISMIRYRDDGTREDTAYLEAGDPLIQRKFSLAKLAWLGHNGPNAAAFDPSLTATQRETAIKTTFGLTWNTGMLRWDYAHGDDHRILSLYEVAVNQERAPDFFELLKAGILNGSLGNEPGIIAQDINGNATQSAGPVGRHYETYSASVDRHILQIGANIIDQADPNNYPTAVYLDIFTQSGFSASENDFNNCVFGLENLPMLQRVGLINHMMENYTAPQPPNPATDYKPGPMGIWVQPEFWNPNDSSTAGSSPSDPNYPTPSSLRFVTYGKCYVWNVKEDPAQADLGEVIDFGTDFRNPKVDGTICFKNPAAASTTPAPFFARPVSITGAEQAAATINYSSTACPSGPKNRYPAGADWLGSGGKFLGVYLGEVHRDPRAAPFGSPQYNIRAIPDFNLTFVVEYFDGTDWRPYAMLSRLETLHDNGGGSGSRTGDAGWRSHDGHIDPRTDRFSGSAGRNAPSNIAGWDRNKSIRDSNTLHGGMPAGAFGNPIFDAFPRPSSGFTHVPVASNNGTAYVFDSWAMNRESFPAAEFPNGAPVTGSRYMDPDGLTRPGDAWHANFNTGDGVMMFPSSFLTPSASRRRPIILNRPFRNPGELGYVFRDQPFRTLDLWSDKSADSAILDLFCISSRETNLAADKVNPNSAPSAVLLALINGTAKQPTNSTITMSLTESNQAATAISTELASARGPLDNPASLVNRMSAPLLTAFSNDEMRNKGYGETPVRALSSFVSTNTWNLLIDVVAQSGKVAATATGLQDFVVEGERRYWMHLSLDRRTGEILASQLEPYNE